MVALLGKRRLYGPKDKKFTTSDADFWDAVKGIDDD